MQQCQLRGNAVDGISPPHRSGNIDVERAFVKFVNPPSTLQNPLISSLQSLYSISIDRLLIC